ncbi:MAG TPA: hypothetical protein PKJ14_03820 [Candidatus Cloacimonadota bacterium]|nr:hypothetical protein [Candidatus Cloacimonadota bacterium]HQL15485.1 hypothetical protein [Candidatus Cloacimonadota bacterium]
MDKQYLSIEEFWEIPEEERYLESTLADVSTEDLKKILEEYNLTEKEEEIFISELKRRDPSFVYTEIGGNDLLHHGIHYPALETLIFIYKLVGWVLIIAGLIGLGVMAEKSALIAFVILIVALIFALLFFAYAESIKVLTDISSFTYQILKNMKSKNQS